MLEYGLAASRFPEPQVRLSTSTLADDDFGRQMSSMKTFSHGSPRSVGTRNLKYMELQGHCGTHRYNHVKNKKSDCDCSLW